MNCHCKDEAEGRTRFFRFNWIGGGFNSCYARDAKHVVELCNDEFNEPNDEFRIEVDPSSVVEVEPNQYYNNMPFADVHGNFEP